MAEKTSCIAIFFIFICVVQENVVYLQSLKIFDVFPFNVILKFTT